MPITVKTKLALKDMPANIKKNFSREIKSEIADVITGYISSGKSPVTGRDFAAYHDSYAKVKGRKKPVDLMVTGTMLDSLRVKQNKIGQVKIWFESKIAKYHDRYKLGKRKVTRRLLPRTNREKFAPGIMKFITETLQKAVKKEIRKQR